VGIVSSESKIEQKVVKEAKKLGVIGLKLTSPGNTGVPDRLFLIPGGGPLFIEFKKPGGVLSAKQTYWISALGTLDYKVEVHDNVEQALQAITKAVEAAQLSAKGS
jgi:hypothetical protein